MIKKYLKKLLRVDSNEQARNEFLQNTISALPAGLSILDAGAGELRNKSLCGHLNYVSQDICQYDGVGDEQGLHTSVWDTRRIDIVSDITNIPKPDSSFDVILCSEVFEHLPDPLQALNEFSRLLKPGGKLIITAPLNSLVHFAPYYFSSGFSKYWYEYHLSASGFRIVELKANGDWFDYIRQEITRVPKIARNYGDKTWPIAYIFSGLMLLYFTLRSRKMLASDLGCFGYHCIAQKN